VLAELWAANVTVEAATSVSRGTSSSNRSSTSSNITATSLSDTTNWTLTEEVSEQALVRARYRSDVSQLRRWARLDFLVTRAVSLRYAVSTSRYEVPLFLVRELGADVTQAC
jgi:hypothetical protein